MILNNLTLKEVRNLRALDLEFTPQFNCFFGDNGAGKTSLLEAIHLLGTGKSFRTSKLDKVIHNEADKSWVIAQLSEAERVQNIKIQRERAVDTQYYLGKKRVQSIADLAQLLPLHLIAQETYALVEEGPKARRSYLDHGLFHVEHHFLSIWRQFVVVHKQKNALLKNSPSSPELQSWNEQFIQCGEALSAARLQYFTELQPFLDQVCLELCPELPISFTFYPGYSTELGLAESLYKVWQQEIYRGCALLGPQRADLLIKVDGRYAHDVLSRGQKKLLVYALQLAKACHLQAYTLKRSIYLIDEMPAELDKAHRHQVGAYLAKMQAQVFLTGAVVEDFADFWQHFPAKMFHMKHGTMSTSGCGV